LWWYATNLTAVFVFKLIYFDSVYRQGFFFAAAIQTSTPVDAAIRAALIFTADAFQVGIIVLAAFLVARQLVVISLNALMLFITLLILFIGVGNALSLHEVGAQLSIETLLLSIDWIRADPSIINEYIGRRNVLGVAIFAGWCSIPFLLTRLEADSGADRSRRQLLWGNTYRVVVTFIILGSSAFAYHVFKVDWWWILGVSILAAALMPRYLRLRVHHFRYLKAATKRLAIGGTIFVFVVSGMYQLRETMRGTESSGPMSDGYILAVARSLRSTPTTDYKSLPAVSIEELSARYDALVYPKRDGLPRNSLIDLEPANLERRHIVIISLETAPMRFYRLFDDTTLPNFYRLSQQAIISEHHYSNTPFTTGAAASISSGLYAPRTRPDGRFPPYTLPRVLGEHHYLTRYFDSFLIDWRSNTAHRRMYEMLGYQRLADAADNPGFERGNTSFDYEVRLEEEAIERVASAVLEVDAVGEKAMVFLQTGLGHFPWNAPEIHAQDPAEDRLDGLVREYDKIIGILVERLDEAGLTDQTIIVITGDHGLRYNGEFQSVGLQIAHSDAAFNVPLIISAPGLLDQQVRVPFVTSHVDLTPTLLSLVGISLESMFHHGADILTGAPADRVTYMMNTGLSPVDGLHWKGFFLTYDSLRGITELATDPTRSDARPIDQALSQGQLIPEALIGLSTHLANARELFKLTITSVYVTPENTTH
jgi:hypothetical protein